MKNTRVSILHILQQTKNSLRVLRIDIASIIKTNIDTNLESPHAETWERTRRWHVCGLCVSQFVVRPVCLPNNLNIINKQLAIG